MNTTPDYQTYAAKMAAHDARAAECLPRNKAALFDVLAEAGIARVVVEFDGYGDSGQIESVEAFKEQGPAAELPDTKITFVNVRFDDSTQTEEQRSVSDVIETMVYDLLRQTHAGWENNEGAYGTFQFGVPERLVRLEFKERHIETNDYEYEF